MAYNKIIYGQRTLLDLTSDTVAASNMLNGTKAHDKAGNPITGNVVVQYYHIVDTEPSPTSIPDGDFVFIRG